MSDFTTTTMTPPDSPPPYDLDVSVGDGKYRVRARNGCDLHVLRHGEPWPERDLAGDGMVLALATELADARDRLITAYARLAGVQIGALDTAKMREEEANWANDEVETLRVQVAALERENALCRSTDFVRILERELNCEKSFIEKLETALLFEKDRADEIHRREVTIAAEYAKSVIERDALRAVLHDISTTAHYLAMSGPASTPTLADAWSQFMRIDVMAKKGLSRTKGVPNE